MASLPLPGRAACAAIGLSLLIGSTLAAAAPIDPCRPAVVCTVQVEDLPAVLLASGGYELRVSGQPAKPLPSSGVAHVAIVEPTIVQLDGAAYQGAISLNPDDCGGDAVHVIEAAPKPAKLVFQVGAVPLSELVVSCVRGCPYTLRPADDFPELPLSRDATELVVTLEFKARGYRSAQVDFKLSPGDNPIRVSMQRIE